MKASSPSNNAAILPILTPTEVEPCDDASYDEIASVGDRSRAGSIALLEDRDSQMITLDDPDIRASTSSRPSTRQRVSETLGRVSKTLGRHKPVQIKEVTPSYPQRATDSAVNMTQAGRSTMPNINKMRYTETLKPRESSYGRNTEFGRPSGSHRGTAIFNVVAIPEPEDDSNDNNNTMRPTFGNTKGLFPGHKTKKYKGRLRMWPGIILLVLLALVALAYVIVNGVREYRLKKQITDSHLLNRKKIVDENGDWVFEEDAELLDVPGNPTVYPDRQCAHVNYISKNNFIYAVAPNGTEVKLPIKGINWSGMETSHGIPYGLWDNLYNGTTVYQVASFLARNNFNSIRLPLSVQNLVDNISPNAGFINTATNTAIDIESYRELLKTLIKAMAYRGISILLDLHTLTPTETGELWYSDTVPESEVLEAIDILGEDLCDRDYWNIVGLDLKNEPAGASWGTGNVERDWLLGSQKLGERMLAACPQWTAHVEGISTANRITIGDQTFLYFDWWGGGLQRAATSPVVLSVPEKVVYSPHYYSPAVYPAQYFYTAGTSGVGGRLVGFEERTDADLYNVVNVTMNEMFGHLTKSQDFAVIMGEFGGLYGTDEHPLKTTKRVIQYTIQHLVAPENNYGGGYVWSLNPESGYEFNPVDTLGQFQYGLLDDDWLEVHQEYLDELSLFDKMDGLKMFPCFAPEDEE